MNKTLTTLILASLIWASSACAMNVTFQWNANTEPDLAGYKIHYQADSNVQPFSNTVDVGKVTSATISNLDATKNYYFSISAYSTTGEESGTSAAIEATEMTPPSLTLTNPTDGETLAGTQTLSATAADKSGVAKVEFYVDGAIVGTVTSYPFELAFNTDQIANGYHPIMVKAYDTVNNVSSQTALANVNNDAQAPVVAITSPLPNKKVSGSVSVAVSATDNIAVSGVMLYVNGELMYSKFSAPYTFAWTPPATGSYTLTAKAYDPSGNLATSTAVNTTVTAVSDIVSAPFVASELIISGDAVAGLGDGYTSIEIGVANQTTTPAATVNFAAI